MSVMKPAIEIIDLGGVNQWIGYGLPKIALVNHIMAGTLDACINWFKNPDAKASSNYGIGKDGRIVQFVDPFGKNCPFANGIVNHPNPTALALLAQMNNANPNFFTVSVEHAGMSGDLLTPAQLDASAHLAAWLCEALTISPDEAHWTGHYEWDSVTRAGCPGWNRAQWLTWESAVNGYLNPVPPPPVPTPDPCVELQAKIDQMNRDEGSAKARLATILTSISEVVADITHA